MSRPSRLALAAWARAAPAMALALYVGLLLRDILPGRTVYWGDLLLYFHPMYRFCRLELLQGRLPLWNPYVLCGQPLAGNPQMGLFYPGEALLGLARSWDFIDLFDAFHLWLCALFMYLFLGRWCAKRSSAALGAMTFVGSGALLGRLQFPPMIAACAYMPFLLWAVDLCLDRDECAGPIALAAGTGLALLAAHPQMAWLDLVLAGCYTAARASALRRASAPAHRRLRPRVLAMAAGLGAGLALSAVQVVPVLSVLSHTAREALSEAQANRFVLEPAQLLTFLDPRFFGTPAQADYWGAGNAWEPAVFVGWLPLGLAVLAALRSSRRSQVTFWAVTALISIWLAMGNQAGLFWVAFHVVPGLAQFHDPARFLLITACAIPVLAALGADQALARWGGRRPLAAALIAGTALPLLVYSPDWLPTARLSSLDYTPPIAARLLGSRRSALLAHHAAGARPRDGKVSRAGPLRIYAPDDVAYTKRYTSYGYADYGPPTRAFLRGEMNTLIPNLPMVFGLTSASGYEPVPLSQPGLMDATARLMLRRADPAAQSLMSAMGISVVLLPAHSGVTLPSLLPTGAPSWRDVSGMGPLRVFDLASPVTRPWLVRRVRRVDGDMRVLAAASQEGFDPFRTAIVSGAASGNEPELGWTSVAPSSKGVLAASSAPGRLSAEVDCGPDPAFLVYPEAACPGWRATLDGRPALLHAADGACMGLFLPPGRHAVRLAYLPDALRVGLYISLLAGSMLTAAVTQVWFSFRMRRLFSGGGTGRETGSQ